MSTSLKQRLGQGPAVLAPGVFDALSALLVERAGFDAAYLSGASVAYTQLGRPDIGLVGFDVVADVIARIRERVELPLVVDADTGWGNALNVQRVVRLFENRGATAIQLEDQQYPKRCGHLSGKALVSPQEMAGKVRAAVDARRSADTLIVARTDAIGVEGFDAALDRAALYAEAGADVLFVEAPQDMDQMRAVVGRFGSRLPLLANMVEGGKTPLRGVGELEAMGFRLVITPGALVRAFTSMAEGFLADLRATGSTAAWRDRMLDLKGLNERIGLAEMNAEGAKYDPASRDAEV